MSREYATPLGHVAIIPPSLAERIVVVWQFVRVIGNTFENDSSADFHSPSHRALHRRKTSNRRMYRSGLSVQPSLFLSCRVVQDHRFSESAASVHDRAP
jgi:hypothetical protein